MDRLNESIEENDSYLDKCPITIKSKEDILKTIDLITQKQVILEDSFLSYDEHKEVQKELKALIQSLARQVKGIRW